VNISFSLFSILGFLFLSAFFSGSETAFFSLSKLQLKKIEKEDTKYSRRIIRLLKKPRELLIIILLGNTIVNVAAASTAALISLYLGENYLTSVSKSILLISEIAIITALLLILGEITPKLIAFSSPQKFTRFSSFALEIIKYALWPLIKILDFISLLFSTKKSIGNLARLTTEDFKNIIKSDVAQNSLEENEKKIISSIFRFSSTLTKEIMTPRVDINAVNHTDGIKTVKKIINESGHSKIPIYNKTIDNIIGILYAKDIILNMQKKSISSLLRPPIIVTENMKIFNLFNQFKKQKIQIAIVVDEYGGTSGLITLEDILEELVGEIRDELDKEEPMIHKKNENDYVINGMYSIAELNEDFELEIDAEYDNVANFLFDQFNKVPEKNENFIHNNKVKFTIIEVDGQRIQYVLMHILSKIDE